MVDDPGRHAVVLGASLAGLLAARVLSETFDRVTILERDSDPVAAFRRGAPQGRHLHGLLERGRQILEELYPGLSAELAAAGAPTTEVLVGSRWYFAGRRAHPQSTGLTSLLAARPLLETVLRARTAARPGVRLLLGATATGLLSDGGPPSGRAGATGTSTRGRIVGARFTRTDGAAEQMPADLVVDAGGRGSRAPAWLAALGFEPPREDRVNVDLGYASRLYRRRPDQLGGDRTVIISAAPGLRGGGAIAVDGDRWHVTLTGMLGDHPPTDPAGFEAFSATLPAPDIYELIRSAEPLTDPVPHRFTGSTRRRYEDRSAPPDGFLAFGDALCSLNPLYAQGMSVTAQQALVLRTCAAAGAGGSTGSAGLARAFHRRAADLIDGPWTMATGSDLRYRSVVGRRTPRTRLVNAYVSRAQVAAHRDPAVALALVRVINLLDPPTALLRPGLVGRTVWRGRGGPAAPAPVSRPSPVEV